MSDIAIRVENLGKQYRIGRQQARYKTIREQIVDWSKSPFTRAGRILRGQGSAADLDETIWALKDVSFEVKQGEVVGVIGRNGAGKTTLLKILSRITEPSTGNAWIHGRVGSLLEVGTGFHPELTGRENIFLNGAILGMKRVDIDRKFDEMVDFAEIEKFIDTPVKHYSSGMYVRLAFSVAAHMEPEILLVDEVLAVGDAQFQKKCLGKMGDVAQEGRTILFVSHSMSAIEALCNKVAVFERGFLVNKANTHQGINYYMNRRVDKLKSVDLRTHIRRRTGMIPILRGLRILDSRHNESSNFKLGDDIMLEVELDPNGQDYTNGSIGLGLYNHLGQLVCMMKSNIQSTESWTIRKPGKVRCRLKKVALVPGEYLVSIAFSNHRTAIDWIDEVTSLNIVSGDVYGTGQSGRLIGGFIVPDVEWEADRHLLDMDS